MTDDELKALAKDLKELRAESSYLQKRLTQVRPRITEIRKEIAGTIVGDIRDGRRTQTELSRLTGYTAERIRQICRDGGIEPSA